MWKLQNLMLYVMRLGAGEDENWGREKRRVSSVQWREKTRLVLSETRWVPDLFVCSNPGFTPYRSWVPLLDLKYCSTSWRQFRHSPRNSWIDTFSGYHTKQSNMGARATKHQTGNTTDQGSNNLVTRFTISDESGPSLSIDQVHCITQYYA